MNLLRTLQNRFIDIFGGEFTRAARNFYSTDNAFIQTRRPEFLGGTYDGPGRIILPTISTFRDRINDRRNRHTRFRFN